MKKIACYLLATGLSLCATNLFAGPLVITHCTCPPPPPASSVIVVINPQNTMQQLARYLDLTRAQKQEIADILFHLKNKLNGINNQMDAIKDQLADYRFSHYNAKKVSKLADDEGQLLAKAVKLRAKAQYDIYDILTPEQRLEITRLKYYFF